MAARHRGGGSRSLLLSRVGQNTSPPLSGARQRGLVLRACNGLRMTETIKGSAMPKNTECTVHPGTPEAVSLDLNHQPNDDPFWQESWYFNFSDPETGVWGLTRIGYRPSKGVADGLLLALIDGEPRVLYAPLSRPLTSSKVVINPLELIRTNGLEYRCDEALVRWRLTARTPRLDFDVTFDAENSAHVFPKMESGKASAASDHYEQSGKVTGKLRIGDTERSINGRGQRDHSWGPRDWSGVGDWIWLSGQFASGWCFNWWTVGQGSDSTITGFVGKGETTIPSTGGSVTWIGDPSGFYPTGADIVLDLADGTQRKIRMTIHGYWPLFKDGATIIEFVCTYECDGEKGSGISEHLFDDPHPVRTHLPKAPRFLWTALRTIW